MSPAAGHKALASAAPPRSGRLNDQRKSRAHRTPSPSTGSVTKPRVSHACDRCRTMRTKCSGGMRCTKCTKDDAVCAYGDRKRERNKKDLSESLDRIDVLEDEKRQLLFALKEVTSNPNTRLNNLPDLLNLISKLSAQDDVNTFGPGGSQSQSHSVSSSSYGHGVKISRRHPDEMSQDGEKNANAEIGSPGHQGELSHLVDLNHGTGLSGFVGKMSEMSWMQRAREHLAEMPTSLTNEAPDAEIDQHTANAQNFAYYMDDQDLLAIDEDHINPHQWPPFQIALILSEAYFHSVQGSFSFIMQNRFMDKLSQYPRNKPMPSWSERRWLALANIVWAIGAKWIEMTNLEHPGFPESHLMYYARARALGLDHRVLLDHPDVEMVQGVGLMALYLLVNGSISRAWNSLGQAIRHATALGLHLKVSDSAVDATEHENRAQTWCSLFDLETLIAEITGRPKSVHIQESTVPLHLISTSSPPTDATDEDRTAVNSRALWLSFLRRNQNTDHLSMASSNTSPLTSLQVSRKHFAAHHHLCEISGDIWETLYVGRQGRSWYDTQQSMQRLENRLAEWRTTMPGYLQIEDNGEKQYRDPRPRIELAMYYQSLCMILYRPCLCDIRIQGESETSIDFNRNSAQKCVNAALALLEIMPDNPEITAAFRILPWWTLLHYICQATAVLLVELCLEAQHFEGEGSHVVAGIRKAMAYLWGMAEGSKSAYKAYRILRSLIGAVASRYDQHGTISELKSIPLDATVPLEWSEDDEVTLRSALK